AITGSSATGAVDVVNLGDTPLTGLSASVASAPGNLTVTPTLSTNRVEAQGTIHLNYSVTALDASQPQGIVQLHIVSAEGASTDETLGVAVWPATSHLACDQTSLKAAMPIGGQQRVQFAIINQGGAASGPITISVPSLPWLTVGNVNPLPSLAPGASNIVTLVLTPAADLPLGPYTGTMVVFGQSSSLNLPFNFLAMSQLKGDLTVQVQDEFTFYAAGSPLVTNASISIIDPVSLATVTNGYTGTNGFATFAQLPEAWYNVEITEPNHSSYKGTVLVHGGTTNVLQAFISRQLVTYSWTVVPTTVEDRTRITIQTTFETFVPAPVVTVDPPMVDLADYTNDLSQISLVISNHGLIAAQDVKIYP
ncbi:MAG TPA: hypothetical protein VNM37_05000, partial [Candidatus Dormibacteraeota bacterium]|nr:hypothetical protein [Candidatus Dormibacteraeota bacterium]